MLLGHLPLHIKIVDVNGDFPRFPCTCELWKPNQLTTIRNAYQRHEAYFGLRDNQVLVPATQSSNVILFSLLSTYWASWLGQNNTKVRPLFPLEIRVSRYLRGIVIVFRDKL